ncbi:MULTISPECIES: type I restriction-modification system endonuclease [Acinetobacter]|uniref:Type I restriction-modification system endonuclease n=1 Tax=Acinetobacter soli TaxID=487316 RepID=A0AB38Z1L6_9GAMM|nr:MULTISPECIES: type I restriction-modification system endonuclease [Acinetobacter]KOR13254.1 hypothetical protein ABW55_14265 [Acinetobacter sp. C15]KQD03782.1 hypothetical protein APD01_12005 [Acinetobacter soli]WND07456.1 type I restriction-modification system endonuclease [Acinetobacter soli]
MMNLNESQFDFLKDVDPLMHALLVSAEVAYYTAPAHTLVQTRKFAEALVNKVAQANQLELPEQSDFLSRIRLVENRLKLKADFISVLHTLRVNGNKGAHDAETDHSDALTSLRLSYRMAQWLYILTTQKTKLFPEFEAPVDPTLEARRMRFELMELQQQLRTAQDKQTVHSDIQHKLAELEAENLQLKHQQQVEAQTLQAQLAAYEAKVKELEQQATMPTLETPIEDEQLDIANASFELSEAETRELIDRQLQLAGWQADTQLLRYSNGVHPQKGLNLAIAEYPTLLDGEEGFADYVLFEGLMPVAVVEAKKQNKTVSQYIRQAERYSQGFQFASDLDKPYKNTPWTSEEKVYHIPFVYACNGQKQSKRLADEGGVWFRDVRHPSNISRVLQGFHSPAGLKRKLEQDIERADEYLEQTEILPFNDRAYQREGIKAVEHAIAKDKQRILLAMATGTGKTRLATGLMYRLIKSQRFKHILFLVDRSTLGTQAFDAFGAEVIEQGQTLAQIYTVADLGVDTTERPEFQVATVQSLVHRLFNSDTPLPIDFYDCIIIDEAHRGYTLDKEMTEGEEKIRDEAQYLSTYKRVIDYFDATLIGLTATPALHTTEIFDKPVFTYSFTRAVEEGYLVNYDKPIRYITKLSQAGIEIPKGTSVQVMTNATGQKTTALIPDDMDFDVADFNRRVINESFNKVICQALVEDLNPLGDEKTMIFCVTDRHADQVVALLNELFKEKYGKDWNNDAVVKITGNADQPSKLVESYKKNKFPNIAVTVDLLTTGIDVPKICNLVFMRKVRSRVLFEQMLGRATRLCPDIGKTEFRIYDAVDIFATLQVVNTMQPIVVRPNISIDQLIRELSDPELMQKAKAINVPCIDEVKRTQADIVLDEFIQKVTRILGKAEKFKHHPDQVKLREALGKIKENFKVDSFKLPQMLRAKGVDDLGNWLQQNSAILEARLAEVCSALGTLDLPIISDEKDELIERVVDTAHQQPEDYLEYFDSFVKTAVNDNAAIKAVVTRPSDLTREQLRELENLLTRKGFTQSKLTQALGGNESNQTYASQIISMIRRSTLGEEISSVEERYQRGLNRILQQRAWTEDQKQWLARLTLFIAKEVVVDKNMIHHQFAKDGGVKRLSKLLDSDVEKLVDDINEGLWQAS